MILTPWSVTTSLSATEPSTLPPFAAAMSTMTDPGRMVATMSPVMIRGAGLPGMSAVVTMMSVSLTCSAYISAAARLYSSDVSLA